MRKILLLLPIIFSITGCNYFADDKAPTGEKGATQKIITYNKVGNAESIIRPSIEERGYKLAWQAKGNYSISSEDLARVKGKSLGQALTEFQDGFTTRNLNLEKEILISHPNVHLGHHPYVLIFVCKDTIYVKEYSSADFTENKRKLRYQEVEGCALPSSVLVTKDELALRGQPVAQTVIPQATNAVIQNTNIQTESKAKENFKHEPEDQSGEDVDINTMDFRNIVLTPDFIKELEENSGQKFDVNKYNENQKKIHGSKQK